MSTTLKDRKRGTVPGLPKQPEQLKSSTLYKCCEPFAAACTPAEQKQIVHGRARNRAIWKLYFLVYRFQMVFKKPGATRNFFSYALFY